MPLAAAVLCLLGGCPPCADLASFPVPPAAADAVLASCCAANCHYGNCGLNERV
jgi:hypothetical protein